MTLRSLAILTFMAAGMSSGIALPVAAEQSCAARDKVLEQLATKYGETRQSIGLAPENGVVEVFASQDTGTWTILFTRPDGMSCMIASGQAFETLAAAPVAKGDDA